ncbi:response regulator [Actinophytocola algeriensis]|uniref:DNA-binding NarL/FixJ family response regulator n=1 Tax=Actinophytocola algeriensis TaxID=1768010 RepID=A0A7W7VIX2_9PSEU|nr:response regulator transcription factor [Actinophytocola algeriensis]MBB4911893.1 DNA-binding NarL/FixJ family response regulator [Actinophytocola algeriensis]MBE1477615.1 DNA-binding NarL/FixJ family response regulator [Actinophytocola algeriensis]
MIRVLLADDEAMIRAGLTAVLATDPGITVVAEAADGREAVELAHAHRPDVVLMDIRMPRLDGLAAAAELAGVVPVVMLTTFDEDAYVARALADGASGFLLKAADPRELLIAVRAVADGAAYLSPRVAHRVIAGLRTNELTRPATARKKVSSLTPRERDVLALVGRGLSNQEIGRELHLAEGTVKAHLTSILRNLDVQNRVQAAITAYEAGMASPPPRI